MDSNFRSQLDAMEALLDINKLLDEKAHSQGLTFTTMDPSLRVTNGLSTGIYSFDLITGGGYAPGRFSYLYGDTGSAKSTTLYHGMHSSLSRSIITVLNDHESSMDPTYLKKIGIDLDDVCGVRNKKGTWEVTPKLRYTVGTTAESTFKFMNLVMKALPDKIQMWDPKAEINRYFLISPDFEYKPVWTYINKGLKEEKIIEVEDFSPQMVFITDSLKAMLPDARDEDLDSEPIALLARCFSASFPLVKSLIGRKNCIYLATNHLTVNPMVKFGSPESEPGGKAVQFYPDLKIKMHVNRAQSKIIEETHVSGEGIDRYILGKATVLKNKSGPCFRSLEFRIWLDEQGSPGRGIDPVYDIHTFLDSCGLLEHLTKDSFGIKIPGWETQKFTWKKFKELVLVKEEGQALRNSIEAMLADGSAQEKYYQTLAANMGKTPTTSKGKDDGEKVETIEL
jgi:RecA/RadA recombinase